MTRRGGMMMGLVLGSSSGCSDGGVWRLWDLNAIGLVREERSRGEE